MPTHNNHRPNILFIMTDDQTVQEMSCYGSDILQTPNMDRIAYGGTRFSNCFTTNALCAPARATVLTGCFSHIHGIRGNSEKADAIEELDPNIPTFPELLQESGYRTGLVGKYHIRQHPRGFDYWAIHPGQGEYFDPIYIENGERVQKYGYASDITTDLALDFLDLRRHPLEVLEGALVRHRGHGPLNALRRLGTLLTGHQQILFALRLFDLVVESAERRLECFRLGLVTDPRFVQRLRGLHVLVLPHQRLLGQVVAVLLHAEHRPLLPLFRLLLLFLGLCSQLLLVSDRRCHFLFGLCQLTPHVGDQLIQDLLRVFRAAD